MAQAQYCTVADVKNELTIPSSTDDTLISSYIDRACNGIEQETHLTFAYVAASQRVFRTPEVRWDQDGVLRVRLGVPHIQTVTAVDFRVGTPADPWTAVDAAYVDFPTSDRDSWIAVHRAGWAALLSAGVPQSTGVPLSMMLWARVTFTAGWTNAADDPYPADLVQLATGWAAWLYRSKDAPFEKTAQPMMGTVIIPSAFPVKIERMLARWREPWI